MPHIVPKLIRVVEPEGKFKFDLLLYTLSDDSKEGKEHWDDVWQPSAPVYAQFLEVWDKKTCPACLTQTITSTTEEKYLGEDGEFNSLSSWIYYEVRYVYTCKTCQLGWCEYVKRNTVVETSYP